MRLKSKIMRCNKFSSPLCLSVKNIRPWQFFKKNVRPWQFSAGAQVQVVGHFEAARPGLCYSAQSSTQYSLLYPANILLIFFTFKLQFAYKKWAHLSIDETKILTWTITSASLLAVPSSLSCSAMKAWKQLRSLWWLVSSSYCSVFSFLDDLM